MSTDYMNYPAMVEDALRHVVRQALRRAEHEGLRGEHHFYISFNTGDPGVSMPDYLRAQNPQEMTIVLQHQFWGLAVTEESFEVTLSFRGAHERLQIPFCAVTGFADPGVQFGLQFNAEERAAAAKPMGKGDEAPEADNAEDAEQSDKQEGAEVVTLDTFRGKK